MSLLVSLAIRNLGRNRRRTLLTALTVALGTALLTMALAMLNGIFDSTIERGAGMVGHVRVVNPEYARREQLMPLSDNLPDPAPLVSAIEGQPHVLGVFPHIAMGVTAARDDQEIGEIFALLHGAPAAYYTDVLHLDKQLTAGTMPTTDKEALFGIALLEELGAKVGDKVVLLGQTQDGSPGRARLEVVGAVDLGNRMQNRQVWASLAKVQYVADLDVGATELLIQVDDYQKARAVAADLRKLPALQSLDVHAWDERAPFDAAGALIGTIRGIAASLIVFITGLGVLNTMFMSVLERTGEIGVMRAFGLRRWQTVGLFFVEAIAIAAIGGLAGVALGSPVVLFLHRVGIPLGEGASKLPAALPINQTIYPVLTPQILLTGFTLGLTMALVGGLLPAWRAAGIEPVEAMRHRR